MKLQRNTYETRLEERGDFVVGFVGFYAVNAVLFLLAYVASAQQRFFDPANMNFIKIICWGFLPLLINVGGLIYLGFTRKWTALGALAALGIVLALVSCAGVLLLTLCFMEGLSYS